MTIDASGAIDLAALTFDELVTLARLRRADLQALAEIGGSRGFEAQAAAAQVVARELGEVLSEMKRRAKRSGTALRIPRP